MMLDPMTTLQLPISTSTLCLHDDHDDESLPLLMKYLTLWHVPCSRRLFGFSWCCSTAVGYLELIQKNPSDNSTMDNDEMR